MNSDRVDPTDVALEGLARTLAATLADVGWDQPALLFQVDVGSADLLPAEVLAQVPADPSEMGPLWTLAGPWELEGHPFLALMGHRFDDEVIGAALVSEGWMRASGTGLAAALAGGAGVGDLASDIAAHVAADGRTEVRNIFVCLRDGTSALLVIVRDGGVHRLPASAGLLPAALHRVIGAPSGVSPPLLSDLAARVWAATAVSVATMMSTIEVPDDLEDVPEGLLGDAALQSLTGSKVTQMRHLPPPLRVAVEVAQAAGDWSTVAERLVDPAEVGAVVWLLERAAEARDMDVSVSAELAARVAGWWDAPLVGVLVDDFVPDWDEVFADLEVLRASGFASLADDDLFAAATRWVSADV